MLLKLNLNWDMSDDVLLHSFSQIMFLSPADIKTVELSRFDTQYELLGLLPNQHYKVWIESVGFMGFRSSTISKQFSLHKRKYT